MRPQVRLLFMLTTFAALLLLAASVTDAQPGGKKGDKGGKGGGSENVDDFVTKLMAFNKAKDGKLTKEELTDKRLLALFDRADTNKDGVVTREELEALFAREKLEGGGFGGGDKGKGPKDGFGPDKKGFKGKGPQQFGGILPGFLQDALNLTDAQRKQVGDLQKEVDGKLDKILTDDQRSQLREMREKGPKGPPPDKK
jgi:Spy/CpxP family protein refolding chaperone